MKRIISCERRSNVAASLLQKPLPQKPASHVSAKSLEASHKTCCTLFSKVALTCFNRNIQPSNIWEVVLTEDTVFPLQSRVRMVSVVHFATH
jgi:hypothetical protein